MKKRLLAATAILAGLRVEQRQVDGLDVPCAIMLWLAVVIYEPDAQSGPAGLCLKDSNMVCASTGVHSLSH